MLRCWTSTKAAIAAAKTATPINSRRDYGAVARSGRQQRRPGDHKHDLGRRGDRDVHDHAGRRLHARNALLIGEPRGGDVAAHARDRQERADRFADPADPGDVEDVGPAWRRYQLPPRHSVKKQRDEMKQRYRRQPPAEDQHGASHLRGAAVDDKEHDQQEAEKPSDDQRCWNDMAPSSGAARGEDRRGIRSRRGIVYE